MKNKILPIIFFLISFITGASIRSFAQEGIYSIGNKFTFEAPKATSIPPGYTAESWQLKRQEIEVNLNEKKVFFGNLAFGMAQELHQCFRIISDNDKILRLKEAAKRHALSLFKDARGETLSSTPYFGMVLGENGQLNEQYVPLDAYMDMLISQTSRQEGVNICWALPGEASGKMVQFKPAGFSSPILMPNGEKHPDNLLYEVYRGSLPVRERIGFLKNGLPVEQILCKEMFFELRCFLDPEPKLNPTAPDRFFWQVSFIRIGKMGDEKSCDNLPEVACSFSDLPLLTQIELPHQDSLESNDLTLKSSEPPKAYKPVSPVTYLLPGFGIRHFQTMKEKKPAFSIWPVITGLWIGSGFFAIISKRESNIDYEIHKKTFSIAENEWSYNHANEWHHRSLLSAAACLSIWIINDTHVFLRDSKARRISRELFMQNIPSPPLGQFGNNKASVNSALSLGLRIQF
jgi:hypothetical protein